MHTAMAMTMSSGGSLDDTMRNTTSRPTPDHRTRRHCCDTDGVAMMTRATAAAMRGEVAKAGSVSSMTWRVLGSMPAITPRSARSLVSSAMASPAPVAPSSRAAAWRNRRRAASATSTTNGTTTAPITARPVSTSAKRSGTRWYTSTRSRSAPPIVLRAQVATATPTPTRARPTSRRTTSAWDRTRRRGETDTTTPAVTPTWSLVTPSGARGWVLCTRSSWHGAGPIPATPTTMERSGRGIGGQDPGSRGQNGIGLELGQHRVGRADVEARRRLDHELGHDTVLQDGRVALGAGAEAEPAAVQLQAHLGREVAVAVGQHEHRVAGVLGLAPGAHDEDVVHGDAGHGVDALGPEVVGPEDEAGQVVVRAGGREGARDREQDDLALAQHVAALHGAGTLVGHRHQLHIGDAVANRDRHRSSSRDGTGTPRSCLSRDPPSASARRCPDAAAPRPGGWPGRRAPAGLVEAQMRRP